MILKVREVREAKNLTRTQLQELSGVHQSLIWRIEHEEISPSIHTMAKICRALGVSLDELVVIDGNPKRKEVGSRAD